MNRYVRAKIANKVLELLGFYPIFCTNQKLEDLLNKSVRLR
jgi:hypothetical protein